MVIVSAGNFGYGASTLQRRKIKTSSVRVKTGKYFKRM
jgi:hypothetical protein